MKKRNTIRAVILNGRHGGTTFVAEYSPIIDLPILDHQISVGEKDDGMKIQDRASYYECFRSVDGEMVLYSTDGDSRNFEHIMRLLKPTHPISLGA